MKKYIHSLLFCLLFMSCIDNEIKQDNIVPLQLNVSTYGMHISENSRAFIEYQIPDNESVGVTAYLSDNGDLYDSYNNIRYTSEGVELAQRWESNTPILLTDEKFDLVAYYPYDESVTDITKVPVKAGKTDYLYASTSSINNLYPLASFQMKHALAGIKFQVSKNSNYEDKGILTKLVINGDFHTEALLNTLTGELSDFSNTVNSLIYEDNVQLGAVYNYIAIPDGQQHSYSGYAVVDGITFEIPSTSVTLQPGTISQFNITINTNQLSSLTSVEIIPWTTYSLDQQSSYVDAFLNMDGVTDDIAISYRVDNNGIVTIDAVPKLPTDCVKEVTMTTSGNTIMSQSFNSTTGGRKILLKRMNAPTTLTFNGVELNPLCIEATYNVSSTRSGIETNIVAGSNNFDLSTIHSVVIDYQLVPTARSYSLSEGEHTVFFKMKDKDIPEYMFHEVPFLTGIQYQKEVSAIGEEAFSNCASLVNIGIPNSVTAVGSRAFAGCTSLTGDVSLHEGITELGNAVFKDCTLISGANILCPGLSEELFSGCTSLNTVVMSNNITQIPDYAFNGCTSLTSINIPVTVETIGNYSFGYCSNLNEIECKKMTAPAISSTSYWGVSSTGVLSFSGGATGYDSWISETEGYLNPDGWTLNEMTSYYTVDLNGQWRESSVANPDATLYDGVYESNSNYNVNSNHAYMYIKVFGYETFTIYIRSYAESSYDYVMASTLDSDITGSTSYSSTSLVAGHTRSKQNSSTAISGYQKITYTLPDKGTEYTIKIVYRKDGSGHSGTDRGYLLIEKQ